VRLCALAARGRFSASGSCHADSKTLRSSYVLYVCVWGGGGAQNNPHSLQGVEDNSRKGTANIFRSAWRNIFRCEVRLGAFSSAIRDSSTKITGKLNCRGEMDSKFTLMQASYATEFPATTATLKDEIKWTPCSSSVTMTVSTDV